MTHVLDVDVGPNPWWGVDRVTKKEGHGFRLCDSPVARMSRRSNSVEFVSVRGTHAARGLLLRLPRAALRALLQPDALPVPSFE
ncbi:hypothetical protein GOAMI_30_00090 [Gordonia amicalis NBRC 100051 = JCM 11271]|nr:hypothetical protein GOAMI_30_00090 [Gordonia amicalis NBRC 100051 = JCM 11271]